MAEAHLKVVSVGPMVSVQDAGRPGNLRYGVCASGPMDRFAHACSNVAIDKPAGISSIEVSLGGLTLECQAGEVSVAIVGAEPIIQHNQIRLASWCVATLRPGDQLAIRGGAWGSFSYLSFAGELQSKHWLGSTATHSLSGFGGGSLQAGDEISILSARSLPDREGALPIPDVAHALQQVQVVVGPQDSCFSKDSQAQFLSQPYKLTAAFDRMGVRLDGPQLQLGDALSIPSEPVLRGSVQVSGDGTATVLLADHQTTGGYPKIATLLSVDTDRFVQLRSGQSVQFNAVSPQEAISRSRAILEQRQQYLATIKQPRGTLEYRLMNQNLIDGIVSGDDVRLL